MGVLKKPYQLSVWKDELASDGTITESPVATIGCDNTSSQCYARDVKFKRKVDGANELSFKMYRKYFDNSTGQKESNPLIDLIANETKLKLFYDGQWFDFIVKNISQDSTNHTYQYQASDIHVNELSKNGYGLVLDTSLMNNMGTATELADAILADTDWTVSSDSDYFEQYSEEPLARLERFGGGTTLVPYSCLKNKPEFFQFFLTEQEDADGVIRGDQAYVEVNESNPYVTDKVAQQYGFYYPKGWKFVGLTDKRGDRLVYTHKSKFNPALNKVVYYYNNDSIAGYTDTEYIAPNLIQNLITNNSFKSLEGWGDTYWVATTTDGPGEPDEAKNLKAVIKAKTSPDLTEALKDGSFSEKINYTPYLYIKLQDGASCVTNSGFYDNRKIIGNISAKQKFVLFYRESTGSAFTIDIAEQNYLIVRGCHSIPNDKILTFFSNRAKDYPGDNSQYKGYKYIVAEVNSQYELNEKEFQKLKTQIYLSGITGAEYEFFDIQLFPFYMDADNPELPILPTNQIVDSQIITKYSYYSIEENPEDASAQGYKATAQEYKYLTQQYSPQTLYRPSYTTEKVRSINVKQSNYFNAIQSLCETFECWAEIRVHHSTEGHILSKEIALKKYIGQDNHVGFRYGVNLKSTKRVLDSKQVVSKLIVPDNSNQYAKNGFCSIARAGANPTGENYIYNFRYYVNMELIRQDVLDEILHGDNGYYPALLELNTQLTKNIDAFSALSGPLATAQAAISMAETGLEAAKEGYQEAADSFLKLAGFPHTDIQKAGLSEEEIETREQRLAEDKALSGYFAEIAEHFLAYSNYSKQLEEAEEQYNGYRKKSDEYSKKIRELNSQKESVNLEFFKKMYRFIQEGTWKNEEYDDDEKYYIDAFNTSCNSCLPKVTYTFSVLDLGQVEDYENITFRLADKTWVEDPEFFGYDSAGNPYREEVVITEVEYTLDAPEKNTVKVQNHNNQFADLFRKQTATVQQVNFAKGNWDKATSFTDSIPSSQAAYLQNALQDAELVLQNAGEQTVVWDKDGITVTDVDTPSQQIRIVGGAILLRDEDEDGLGWKTGMTSKGISAKLLTSGQLNTGAIQIMNNDEPYFRWDLNGITAYYFDLNKSEDSSYSYGLDTHRGVRFDRLGIYGFRNPVDEVTGKKIDGAIWRPASTDDIRKHGEFALTWDGLFLNLGHAYYDEYYYYNKDTGLIESVDENGDFLRLETPLWHSGSAAIGKTSKKIFNKWITDKESPYFGLPYYDPNDVHATPFAKIFSVGGADGNDELAIYDDGTLVARRVKLMEEVQWTANASPSKTVYGKFDLKEPPPPNSPYSSFPVNDGNGTEEDPYVWHQKVSFKDLVYAHTDDGGATWQGPFLITGRSVVGSEIHYAFAEKGTAPSTIPESDWSAEFPTESRPGKCIYTRSRDVYDNGEVGEWSYSVGFIGSSPVVLEVTTPSGNLYIGENLSAVLTVRVSQENIDITENFDDEHFIWEKYDSNGVRDPEWYRYGKTIYIDNTDVFKKAVFNCVLTLEPEN